MINSFPAFIDSNTKILILGTMPGIASLTKQEYYANPRNHFWRIMYTLFDTLPVSDSFEEKIQLLQKNKIGLWDVLENCERKGSLDIYIKNHKENDFEMLFKQYPTIHTGYAGTDVHHERHIKAFQNKVIINSNATIELQNALDNNHFFIS